MIYPKTRKRGLEMFSVFIHQLISRVKFEVRKEFSNDSHVTLKNCEHRALQKFPKDLYCCIECRRTFLVNTEVKLNKYQFAELLASLSYPFGGNTP
jgi:hypothetical protein